MTNSHYAPVIHTAEPFLFKGGETGILLVHGFTGAPKEMRWMGEYLAGMGHTILGIRLAGHATQLADLSHLHWMDWLHSVEDGYHLLRSCTSRIFIMGLSLGGILTLVAASQLPMDGAVAMSTPYALPEDPRLPFVRYLAYLQPEMPKGPPDWRDPVAAKDHIDYPFYPTKGIAELRDLLARMRQSLPRITVPVLLIHSRNDTGVPPENMSRIYNDLGKIDKQIAWVENSGHVITREPERERVFQLAAQFVNRVSGITE